MQTIYAIGSRYLDANNFHTQAKSLSILNYILKCEHNLWKLISWFMTVCYLSHQHAPLGYATVLFILILSVIIFMCMYQMLYI